MRNAAALLVAMLTLSLVAGATAGPVHAAQLPTNTALSTQASSVGIYDAIHLLAVVRETPEDGGNVSLYRNGTHVMDRDLSPNGAANFALPDGLWAGTHSFVAVFNGTAGSETSTSDPVVIDVVDDRTPTTTVLELLPSTIEKDESVTFRVTITPAPGEAVDVPVGKAGHGWDVTIDGTTGVGERILTPEEHQAEMIGHGAFPLVAFYPGTTLTAPSQSTTQWLTVIKHPTTTTVAVEPGAVTPGSAATITVSVEPPPTSLFQAGVTVVHPTLADWSAVVPLDAAGDGSVAFDSTGWPDGTFAVTATWAGTNDDASSTGTSAITIDSTGPVGSVVIGGGAAYTKTTAVTLTVTATDALRDVDTIQLSNDGTSWTTRPYAASQPWILPAADGTRTVRVRWRDDLGNWSMVATDSIVLDRVAPTTSVPSRRLPAGTVLSSGRIPLRSTWTGADATSGIHHHEMALKTDGGSWTAVGGALANPTLDRALATEHDYQVRVRAVDKAGNIGAWVQGTPFRVTRVSEFNPRIAYTGTWTTVSNPALFGGGAERATTRGARATLAFTGRSVAWIASTGPDRGQANVYIDGVRVASVDLHAASPGFQRVVWAGNWTTSASRTVEVRVVGTVGRPAVDIDAFVTTD